jgi:hypothetical protein
MSTLILVSMLIIVLLLAFYAGNLLYKLRGQTRINRQRTTERIETIVQSIKTIASAMSQQQCNMSEGCIRLYRLLETLPLKERPDFGSIYVGVYSLYSDVNGLASHEKRKELSSHERHVQDTFREEKEAALESVILQDVNKLKSFSIESP